MTAVSEETRPEGAIVTADLTKLYGSLVAVDQLDLSVPNGSIFGLIGPNGAGKTTTFQILATLLEPTAGTAWIGGRVPWREPAEVRRLLGFMPDFFGVYDDVRVYEYLEFFARSYRLAKGTRDRVVIDLLELVDLSHKKDDFVESLSRGMKQRLGLARALVHDPQVLILDEPASGLDPRARVELRETMLELRRMGKTILISTHILSELEEVCTHVGVIEAGRLVTQGPKGSILSGIVSGRAFRLRLAEGASLESAADILRADDSVVRVEVIEEGLKFVLTGGDGAAAGLLAKMANAQIPIVEFAADRAGLEELFMNVTKGIVQ